MADRTRDIPITLHIGPHKTGTTTLQSGLAQNRARLREQGVIYPGRLRHELSAATAVSTRAVDPGRDLQLSTARWFDLLTEIRSEEARLGILSSEFYCETPAERIGWLMSQLGPQSRVVITLRPLAKIVASQWQQFVQNQTTVAWDDWLKAILAEPTPGMVTPVFWVRHRHDLLVRRWLDVVGPDRLTVVVVDDREPEFILRSFENLLDVEPGSLTPRQPRTNRSLTLEEVELVRRFNELYEAAGLNGVDYTELIRFGAIRFLQNRPVAPNSQRILMPEWARPRVTELARMMVDDIAASGATVIGCIDHLADPDLVRTAAVIPTVATVRPELAADLAAGVVDAMGRYRPQRDPDEAAAPILTAVLRSRRSADAERAAQELKDLRRSVKSAKAEAAAQKLITEADRRDVLDELRRRARRRLRRLVRRTAIRRGILDIPALDPSTNDRAT